jgi:hypothetical protein
MEPLTELWPISDTRSECISIYDGPETFLSEFAEVSKAHQVAFAAGWFQGEVFNGGLAQFFANDTGVLAPEAVEACRTVGLPRLAAKLEEAMSWFGARYPRMRSARKQALERYAESKGASGIYHENPFDSLDDEIVELLYDENEGLEAAALRFVLAHGGN